MTNEKKNIRLVEPFFTGSHAAWARGFAERSQHQVEIMSLSGHYWKWRMHGGAVTLARKLLEQKLRPDLILATDMLDLATFLGMTRSVTADIPVILYMHENQLTYPWSPDDRDRRLNRDNHYAFINFTSALVADRIYLNSAYHRTSFLAALPGFLRQFPDHNELTSIQSIEAKCEILPLGMELESLQTAYTEKDDGPPLILWNHRWEYDKNPEAFFEALFELQDQGLDFRLAVLGQQYRRRPAIFDEAQKRLASRIVQWGYVESFEAYARWLWKADILPVTSVHDFFGASVVEAMYCNCYPLLPDRLAYPEHIPPDRKGEFLYNGVDALVEKLTFLVRNPEVIRKTKTQEFVAKYNWRNMIGEYDRLFLEMM